MVWEGAVGVKDTPEGEQGVWRSNAIRSGLWWMGEGVAVVSDLSENRVS